MRRPIFTAQLISSATSMTRLEYNRFRNWKLPDDEDGSDLGYLVLRELFPGETANNKTYPDYYASWLPAIAFENLYRENGKFSFGDAVILAKKGHKIARSGWNGKGMFLYYVPENSYPPATEIAKKEFGELVPYGAYLAMKTAQNNVVPWLASQTDVLANDWSVL